MLSMRPYNMEYPFSQMGSAVPAVSSPIFLLTPSPLTDRVGWEAEKTLAQCKPCSALAKTSQYYQHYFQHKSNHNLMPAAVKKISAIQQNPAQLF